jgi:hypothetical protein
MENLPCCLASIAMLFIVRFSLDIYERKKEFIHLRIYMIVSEQSHRDYTRKIHNEAIYAYHDWQNVHPHGAVGEDEHEEYNNLVLNMIGTYVLYCSAHGLPLKMTKVEHLWDKIETWRI